MASFSEIGRLRKRLERSDNIGLEDPPILGYNPSVVLTHTIVEPFTLTVVETTPWVILKTIITYDKVYPKGNVISITEQKIENLDPLPDRA